MGTQHVRAAVGETRGSILAFYCWNLKNAKLLVVLARQDECREGCCGGHMKSRCRLLRG